jgi:putative flippase GtrA
MKKAIKFTFVSGIGFIIDFIIYNILTLIFHINVGISNMISSLVGVTFVFFTSTKHIFENNTSNIKLKYKYLIYVVYQIVLILVASRVIIVFKNFFISSNIMLVAKYAKILAKIFITPFTLTINYFVMKKLTKL